MKYLSPILLSIALLGGCSPYERVPLDTLNRAEEVCNTLGGVNSLYISTDCIGLDCFEVRSPLHVFCNNGVEATLSWKSGARQRDTDD